MKINVFSTIKKQAACPLKICCAKKLNKNAIGGDLCHVTKISSNLGKKNP